MDGQQNLKIIVNVGRVFWSWFYSHCGMIVKAIKPEFTNEICTFSPLNIWLLRNVGEAEVKLR